MGKESAGRGGRPGLVALLLFTLVCCVPARGQSNLPDPAGLPAAEGEAGIGAERADLDMKPWSEIRRYRARPLYKRPAGLLLFLPGPLIFLAVLLLPSALRPGWLALLLFLLLGAQDTIQAPGLQVRNAEEAFARGNVRAAAALYTALENDFPDNPALMYNLAVCRHLLGQRGPAIYLLHRSLARRPGDRVIRRTVLALEKEYGLTGQLTLPPPLTAGLPYYLAACLSNLGFGAGAFFFRRRRVKLLIALILLTAAALVSFGFYLTLKRYENRRVGVVAAETAELKMIPRQTAENRLQLPEGTSVYVLGDDGSFMLVETGFGFKGWVEKKVLMID